MKSESACRRVIQWVLNGMCIWGRIAKVQILVKQYSMKVADKAHTLGTSIILIFYANLTLCESLKAVR